MRSETEWINPFPACTKQIKRYNAVGADAHIRPL